MTERVNMGALRAEVASLTKEVSELKDEVREIRRTLGQLNTLKERGLGALILLGSLFTMVVMGAEVWLQKLLSLFAAFAPGK